MGDAGRGISPHPYFFILGQDQNEALLLAALEAVGGQVEWETELVGFSSEHGGVTAALRRRDRTETVRCAYLAGCEGAHSAVRRLAGIGFSGRTDARTYYVLDATVHGTLLPAGALSVVLDDASYRLFLPMPGDHRYRVFGQLREGADQPALEDVRPEIETGGLAQVQQVHWFSTYHVQHRVADTFRSGRAFLLGDAGHVHSPVGGQGMNTGLGDSVNLAWKLAQAVHTGEDTLLGSYEPERRPFAVSLVRTTDRAFRRLVSPTRLARSTRTRLVPALLPLLARIPAARRLLFLTASQTRIHYRRSALSVGRAGRVRGGDRLPWVPQPSGSNVDPLGSLAWQAHVYGDPDPGLAAWCARLEVPLHTFPFTRAARRAGLADGAVYLVRPDGHVGVAARRFDRGDLDAYAARWLPRPAGAHVDEVV